jgi:hypothetical protein
VGLSLAGWLLLVSLVGWLGACIAVVVGWAVGGWVIVVSIYVIEWAGVGTLDGIGGGNSQLGGQSALTALTALTSIA